MITKKVNRYYCEFCKKSGGHAGHMRNHEKACTANADRVCSMCELCDGGGGESLDELKSRLPDGHEWSLADKDSNGPWDAKHSDAEDERRRLAIEGLRRVRELTNCPACILAAIRQRGLAWYCAIGSWRGERDEQGFDWKKERQAVLDAYVPDSPY